MTDPPTDPRPPLPSDDPRRRPTTTDQPESIASLIDRLRYPPESVAADWLCQLTRIVSHWESAAAPGAADPLADVPLTVNDFGVDADNRLVPLSRRPPPPTTGIAPRLATAAGRRAVDAFAAAVRPPGGKTASPAEHHPSVETRGLRIATVRRTGPTTVAMRTHRSNAPTDRRRSGRQRQRILLGVGLAAGSVVTAAVLVRPREDASSVRVAKPAAPDSESSDEDADLPLTTFSTTDLHGFAPPSADEPASASPAGSVVVDETAAVVDPLSLPPVDLDSLLSGGETDGGEAPGSAAAAISEPDATNVAASRAGAASAGVSDRGVTEGSDPATLAAAGLRLPPPEEATASETIASPDRAARQVTGSSIALPPRDEADVWLPLTDWRCSELELDFPSADGVAVQLERSAGQWQLICEPASGAGGAVVAEIRSVDDGTRFRWTDAANSVAAAGRLHRGRLRMAPADGAADAAPSVLFLCQHVQIDPLPFALERFDLRAAWPLGGPPDPEAARLAIDFRLPEDVQFGWVEPLPEQLLRRATAVAQFNLSDDEFVGVRTRIDVQVTSSLSCRVRTAARLDPAMPWQTVSLDAVTQWADRIAATTLATEAALMRIEALYDLADSRERATLRLRRRVLQSRAETFTLATERLGKLIQLMRQLQDQSTIRWQLMVEWPDGTRQPILSTAEQP